MELLGQELRKIWRPGIVAVLAVLGVLYYLLFPRFYVEHFHNGPNAQSDFDIAVGWMERFGPTMEPEERVQVDAQLADEIAVFDDMVADLPEAAAAGIVDYPSYTAFEEAWVERWQDASHDDRFRADSELHARIVENTNLYRLQELQTMMNGYDTRNENLISQDKSLFSQYSPEEQDRIRELENPAREQGYLSMHLEETTTNFAKYVAVWVALSVILLLSPVLVRDRLHRVRALQWSSRQGRRTVDVKCAAGLLSALCPQAEAAGVRLLLAPVMGPETPLIAESPVLGRLEELSELLRRVDSPALGVCLDTNVMSTWGDSIPRWFERLGEHTGLVRLCDGNYHGWRAWGEGVLPMERYRAELEAAGYAGPVSLLLPGERYAGRPSWPEERALEVLRGGAE